MKKTEIYTSILTTKLPHKIHDQNFDVVNQTPSETTISCGCHPPPWHVPQSDMFYGAIFYGFLPHQIHEGNQCRKLALMVPLTNNLGCRPSAWKVLCSATSKVNDAKLKNIKNSFSY